jgi:hypothetical protein
MLCARTDNQLWTSNVTDMTRADDDAGAAGIEEWRS